MLTKDEVKSQMLFRQLSWGVGVVLFTSLGWIDSSHALGRAPYYQTVEISQAQSGRGSVSLQVRGESSDRVFKVDGAYENPVKIDVSNVSIARIGLNLMFDLDEELPRGAREVALVSARVRVKRRGAPKMRAYDVEVDLDLTQRLHCPRRLLVYPEGETLRLYLREIDLSQCKILPKLGH